jgi:hypothetical protein
VWAKVEDFFKYCRIDTFFENRIELKTLKYKQFCLHLCYEIAINKKFAQANTNK